MKEPLTDEDVRRLHAPYPGGLEMPCRCPVCRMVADSTTGSSSRQLKKNGAAKARSR